MKKGNKQCLFDTQHTVMVNKLNDRARKLYSSARIYEWKLGKGEWKFPIARPTGRVDFWSVHYCLFEKNARTN